MINNSHPAITLLKGITEQVAKEKEVTLSVKLHEKDNELGKVVTLKIESSYGEFLKFSKFFSTKDIVIDSDIEETKFFDEVFQTILKEGISSYHGKHILKLN